MSSNTRSVFARVGIVVALALVPSCAPSNPPPAPPQATPSLALDPCADQLHEISGLLLEYYVTQHKLPPTLAELKAMAPDRPNLFLCPTSHQPYVYVPSGVPVPLPSPEPIGRLVLYDATAAHNGLRWGITVLEPKGNKPLVTRIIAVPATSQLPMGTQVTP